MKNINFWNRMSKALRTFFILALVFLALGLGTLGSAASIGKGYVFSPKKDTDGKTPCIMLSVSAPEKGSTYVDENGETRNRDLYIKEVYLNIGAIYAEPGTVATLTIARGTSMTATFLSKEDIPIANFYEEVPEGKASVGALTDAIGNWVKFDVPSTDGWRVTTYPYFKITTDTTILINEIVLVANDQDLSSEGAHRPVALSATVFYDTAGGNGSLLPFDKSKGETLETAVKKASAIVDSRQIPSMAQSSFFRLGPEEVTSMMTVAEVRQGRSFAQGSIYNLDTVYNSLGNALLTLGTFIGGMSPFGLRLMPFLASFGVLVFGFLFVRKLTGSEKAGLVFAFLYALCGVSMSLGHFGVPVMIGLFFFTAALYFTTCFFFDGMKTAGFRSAVPALLGGLFTAAAICVNGAFVIPAVGIVGLFVAGAVRQYRATRSALDSAIDEVKADEAREDFVPGGPVSEQRKKFAAAHREHRLKTAYSYSAFFGALLVGAYFIAMLTALPMYFTYVKLYDDPTNPTQSFFYFLWKAFAGGFVGHNYVFSPQSPWSLFYLLFKGSGESFGVTAAGLLVSAAALLAGVIGAVLSILILVRKLNSDDFRSELVPTLILFVGMVLGLVTAAFAQGGLAFLLIAYLCLFALAGKVSASEQQGGLGTVIKWISLGCLVLLAVCFGLFAVFTFSIPTSGFLSALWA